MRVGVVVAALCLLAPARAVADPGATSLQGPAIGDFSWDARYPTISVTTALTGTFAGEPVAEKRFCQMGTPDGGAQQRIGTLDCSLPEPDYESIELGWPNEVSLPPTLRGPASFSSDDQTWTIEAELNGRPVHCSGVVSPSHHLWTVVNGEQYDDREIHGGCTVG